MDTPYTESPHSVAHPAETVAKTDESSPFVTMWLHPRRTIRRIVGSGWEAWAIPIAMIATAATALTEISPRQAEFLSGMGLEDYGLLAAAAGLKAAGGAVYVLIFGWLVSFSGEWLGGNGETEATRAAVGWSQLPAFLAIPFGIVFVAVHGPGAPILAAGPVESGDSMLIGLTGVVALITAIWVIVHLVATVREVQGFTIPRAIANLCIAVAIPFLPLALLLFIGFLVTGI
jgi:hypothetical protein